ncbi:hypothetical protein MKW98_006336 [Papaver atlanticum]|uniref:PPM-type phosphatase domain-containing protein n=1 Tax=Papaver atlanticum TaxID=357466 RepID=A0AAD4THE9_9MAGN|nr:hypothetical protein MKW98_006336 [Papaver atlanticum]
MPDVVDNKNRKAENIGLNRMQTFVRIFLLISLQWRLRKMRVMLVTKLVVVLVVLVVLAVVIHLLIVIQILVVLQGMVLMVMMHNLISLPKLINRMRDSLNLFTERTSQVLCVCFCRIFLRVKFKDNLFIASTSAHMQIFFMLASDGLWDYTKSSDTVKFVWNQLWLHRIVQLACEALSQATLDVSSARKRWLHLQIHFVSSTRKRWHKRLVLTEVDSLWKKRMMSN